MSVSEPLTFHVHLFPVIRLEIMDVLAPTPEAAVELAQERMPIRELETCLGPLGGEWAEEFSHFLVDVAGDRDFSQSQFFHSAGDPCLSPLRKLLQWDQTGRDPQRLNQVLAEAREVLRISL